MLRSREEHDEAAAAAWIRLRHRERRGSHDTGVRGEGRLMLPDE